MDTGDIIFIIAIIFLFLSFCYTKNSEYFGTCDGTDCHDVYTEEDGTIACCTGELTSDGSCCLNGIDGDGLCQPYSDITQNPASCAYYSNSGDGSLPLVDGDTITYWTQHGTLVTTTDDDIYLFNAYDGTDTLKNLSYILYSNKAVFKLYE